MKKPTSNSNEKNDETETHTHKGFVPMSSLRIDIGHQLEQSTSRFQTIKDGIPELIKNSKDHYGRLRITNKEDRQILILLSEDLNTIGVLDFGGAKFEDFDGWTTWSSRTSGRREMGVNIEAGYGNGGKAFMVRGALRESSMCGYSDGKMNKMGFVLDDSSISRYLPGFFSDENGVVFQDYEKLSPRNALNLELSRYSMKDTDLPDDVQELFSKRKSFTIVTLIGIKEWSRYSQITKIKQAEEIGGKILEHPQAYRTIESCDIRILNARLETVEGPLQIPIIEPFEGLESTFKIKIPDKLIDPQTKEGTLTGQDKNNIKYLEIYTSKHNLRMSDRFKARNIISIWNENNAISAWSVADLVPQPASAYVYGKLTCPILNTEYTAGSDRVTPLIDFPLVRALKEWAAKELEEIVGKIQKLQSDTYRHEDTTAASETLNNLRDLMREYLQKELESGANLEKGNEKVAPPIGPKPPNKYGNVIEIIELENPGDWIKIASGTTVPLVVKCYEKEGDKKLPIHNPKLKLISQESNFVQHVERVSIKGLRNGTTKVWFETQDGSVESNKITIEVIELSKLDIHAPDRTLKKGERIQLDIDAFDNKKSKLKGVYFETTIDQENMGKISRSGVFTAGGQEGETTIRIKWGADELDSTPCTLKIGEETIERKSEKGGPDIPYILLCGTTAPGKDDLPENQRTHPGGEDYPTIIDEDVDALWQDVVWINQHSKEARAVRNRKGRPVTLKSKTFHIFIMIKCFEILKRMVVKQRCGSEPKKVTDFIFQLSEVEMELAKFVDEAYEIIEKINESDIFETEE